MALRICREITFSLHKSFIPRDAHGVWFCIKQNITTNLNDKTHQENTGATKDGVQEEHTSSDYEESIKQKILAASLPFVNEYGWTKNAISAGAETVGYPGVAHGLFPKGGVELVQYFYVTCNQKLVSAMERECEEAAADPTKHKKPTIFIQNAVEQRLRMITPYVNKWPQALAIMSMPPNVPTALANLLTLVDDISYYAGDRSVDFNWYTRRLALGGLYKATELYFIQDKSEDFKDTWRFLKHRIEDISQLHSYIQQSGEVTQVAKEAVTAAFITLDHVNKTCGKYANYWKERDKVLWKGKTVKVEAGTKYTGSECWKQIAVNVTSSSNDMNSVPVPVLYTCK